MRDTMDGLNDLILIRSSTLIWDACASGLSRVMVGRFRTSTFMYPTQNKIFSAYGQWYMVCAGLQTVQLASQVVQALHLRSRVGEVPVCPFLQLQW